MNLPRLLAIICYFAILTAPGPALAAPIEMQATEADVKDQGGARQVPEGEQTYSLYTDRGYADRVFFGDIHFHTNLSFDAGLIGTTLDAHAGYRMARGETVVSNTGLPVRLIRPLDFLAITDHAEMIGLAPAIAESDPTLLAEPCNQSHRHSRSAHRPRSRRRDCRFPNRRTDRHQRMLNHPVRVCSRSSAHSRRRCNRSDRHSPEASRLYIRP